MGLHLMSMRLIGMHLVSVDLIGVYLIGMDLIDMPLMGTGELWIISLNDLCAKLPRTRIRGALNSHSKSGMDILPAEVVILPGANPIGNKHQIAPRRDASHNYKLVPIIQALLFS